MLCKKARAIELLTLFCSLGVKARGNFRSLSQNDEDRQCENLHKVHAYDAQHQKKKKEHSKTFIQVSVDQVWALSYGIIIRILPLSFPGFWIISTRGFTCSLITSSVIMCLSSLLTVMPNDSNNHHRINKENTTYHATTNFTIR